MLLNIEQYRLGYSALYSKLESIAHKIFQSLFDLTQIASCDLYTITCVISARFTML